MAMRLQKLPRLEYISTLLIAPRLLLTDTRLLLTDARLLLTDTRLLLTDTRLFFVKFSREFKQEVAPNFQDQAL